MTVISPLGFDRDIVAAKPRMNVRMQANRVRRRFLDNGDDLGLAGMQERTPLLEVDAPKVSPIDRAHRATHVARLMRRGGENGVDGILQGDRFVVAHDLTMPIGAPSR